MATATAIASTDGSATALSQPEVIMFDLDGTLIDTMFAFADLAAEVMKRFFEDAPEQARRRYLATSGIPFRQQLEVIHPDDERNDGAANEFERRKRLICDSTPLDSTTRAALFELRRRGIKLVVSSNTAQHFVDEFVARERVPFDLALGFDDSRDLAKGEPHVKRTTCTLGVCRDDILFVGDSLKDGELAARAGVNFVGRVGTFDADQFTARFEGVNTVSSIAELASLF